MHSLKPLNEVLSNEEKGHVIRTRYFQKLQQVRLPYENWRHGEQAGQDRIPLHREALQGSARWFILREVKAPSG